MAAAESAANHIIGLYLHPHRATRLVGQKAKNNSLPGFEDAVDILLEKTWFTNDGDSYHAELGRVVEKLVINHLMQLAVNDSASEQVRAIAFLKLSELAEKCNISSYRKYGLNEAHALHSALTIKNFFDNPNEWKKAQPKPMPDGSPIGMDACGFGH
jgi:hypothetical protein